MQQTNQNQQYRQRINTYIRVPQIRLINEDGSSQIINTHEALKLAQDQGLDLIEISPTARPPVCKIMDYGKYKFEEKKKQAAAKKNQKTFEIKEILIRPNTDQNDLNNKLNQTKQFLQEGNRVKLVVKFRGREITHPELGKEKLSWFLQELKALIAPNSSQNPLIEGKTMQILVAPK